MNKLLLKGAKVQGFKVATNWEYRKTLLLITFSYLNLKKCSTKSKIKQHTDWNREVAKGKLCLKAGTSGIFRTQNVVMSVYLSYFNLSDKNFKESMPFWNKRFFWRFFSLQQTNSNYWYLIQFFFIK